jgi:hypothetical protein
VKLLSCWTFQACLLFLSVFQCLRSGFHISTLIALVIHNMLWMKLYKFNPNKTWIYTRVENLYWYHWIMKLGTLNCWYHNGIWVWEILWYLILGQTYILGPSWYIKSLIPDQHLSSLLSKFQLL